MFEPLDGHVVTPPVDDPEGGGRSSERTGWTSSPRRRDVDAKPAVRLRRSCLLSIRDFYDCVILGGQSSLPGNVTEDADTIIGYVERNVDIGEIPPNVKRGALGVIDRIVHHLGENEVEEGSNHWVVEDLQVSPPTLRGLFGPHCVLTQPRKFILVGEKRISTEATSAPAAFVKELASLRHCAELAMGSLAQRRRRGRLLQR